MARARVLVVDGNEGIGLSMVAILHKHGFNAMCVGVVSEALRFISSQKYDVLVSDLHMPGGGDGLTVVSAMRHANPDAVTLLLSAFPEISAAANAILMQTDEILVKPMNFPDLIKAIRRSNCFLADAERGQNPYLQIT